MQDSNATSALRQPQRHGGQCKQEPHRSLKGAGQTEERSTNDAQPIKDGVQHAEAPAKPEWEGEEEQQNVESGRGEIHLRVTMPLRRPKGNILAPRVLSL